MKNHINLITSFISSHEKMGQDYGNFSCANHRLQIQPRLVHFGNAASILINMFHIKIIEMWYFSVSSLGFVKRKVEKIVLVSVRKRAQQYHCLFH